MFFLFCSSTGGVPRFWLSRFRGRPRGGGGGDAPAAFGHGQPMGGGPAGHARRPWVRSRQARRGSPAKRNVPSPPPHRELRRPLVHHLNPVPLDAEVGAKVGPRPGRQLPAPSRQLPVPSRRLPVPGPQLPLQRGAHGRRRGLDFGREGKPADQFGAPWGVEGGGRALGLRGRERWRGGPKGRALRESG